MKDDWCGFGEGPTLYDRFREWLGDPERKLADEAFPPPSILHDMATAVQHSGLLITLISLQKERDELKEKVQQLQKRIDNFENAMDMSE